MMRSIFATAVLAAAVARARTFTDATDARNSLENVARDLVTKLESTYVDIASAEGGYCPAAYSCDPYKNQAGTWRAAAYDEQFSNWNTKSCTRFDRDSSNNFLGDQVTGKVHTCTKDTCPKTARCSPADSQGFPDSTQCRCSYPVISGRFRAEFSKHVDRELKEAFLERRECIETQAQRFDGDECKVNQLEYGYNLPDGVTFDNSARARGEICGTNELVPSFQANAAEYDQLHWTYMGMQETGLYRNWPLIYQCRTEMQCSGCSDPRFRSWYAEAASGPKDVILVLDTSGSMGRSGRMKKMQEAVGWVINTLSKYDRAAVVSFASTAKQYPAGERLMTMDVVGRAKMKNYVKTLNAVGNTNMAAGLTRAFELMASSKAAGVSSGCQSVMLFLTDGENTGDRNPVEVAAELNNVDTGMRIFTYSFGEDSNGGDMKQIACEHGGVWQRVPDDGNLRVIMASYFVYLAAGLTQTDEITVRWSDWFEDGQGLGQIGGACAPVFDRKRSDDEGISVLFGVICPSISKAMWDGLPGAADEWARIEAEDRECPHYEFTEERLEIVRAKVGPESMCSVSGGDGALSGGAIAGIVIGAIALLCVCCAAVPEMNRRKQAREKQRKAARRAANVPVATAVPVAPSAPSAMTML